MTTIRAPVLLGGVLVLAAIFALSGKFNAEDGFVLRANSIEVIPSQVMAEQTVGPLCDLVDKIAEARQLLMLSEPLKSDYELSRKIKQKNGSIKTVFGNILRRQIALAILDTQECTVREYRYWLQEKDISQANSRRQFYLSNIENLPNFKPENMDNQFVVAVNWWNNHNSDLSVMVIGDAPDRYVVVGNKFLLPNSVLVYAQDKVGERYSSIVYVPYSPTLHTSETVRLGKEFLDAAVDRAFQQLTELGVVSRAFPGQLVTETMTQAFVKHLFLTEHTDPKLLLNSPDGGKQLSERVLVRLGLNGENTFRYTYSRTNALGLGQQMASTYASIPKRYPEAGLMKDVNIGRADIDNAIQATILIQDDHLATALKNARKSKSAMAIFVKKTPAEVEEVRAAIYNGGPGKYQATTGTISQRVRETVDFVKKFRMIRALGLFDS